MPTRDYWLEFQDLQATCTPWCVLTMLDAWQVQLSHYMRWLPEHVPRASPFGPGSLMGNPADHSGFEYLPPDLS